jgi:glucose-6-phosphate dehydrogenase assembly protein OpcA
MAPAVTPMRIAGTPERPDVAGIERELRRLWASLDGDAGAGLRLELHGGAPLSRRAEPERPAGPVPAGGDPSPAPGAALDAQATRICTLTLLAVVRNGRPAEAAALAERLGERYPSRSIVLDLKSAEGDAAGGTPRPTSHDGQLDVEIALHCHTRGAVGRQAVCCEQITVTAAGRAIARVPALVLPLLVPDLPVYVLWPGDPPTAPDPAAEVLRRLAEVSDVLIVDSAAMRRPIAGLAAAAVFAGPLPGGVRDLTWGRLTPWRDLIVQSFDPASMRPALERLERVRIRTEGDAAADGRAPIAGLLLGGWLAGRLGWEPAGPARREGGMLRALFWRNGGGLELGIEGGPGPIVSFECAAGGNDPVSLSIIREAGDAPAADIEIRVGRGRPRTTTASLAAPDEAALVGAELELTGPDHVLREALDVVLRVTQGVRA